MLTLFVFVSRTKLLYKSLKVSKVKMKFMLNLLKNVFVVVVLDLQDLIIDR